MKNDDITGLLQAWASGAHDARDEAFRQLYGRLKMLAIAALKSQSGKMTFEPTVLLNDALLKLMSGSVPKVNDREHFVSIVARSIRQVLVDRSRRRMSEKRGEGTKPLSLDEIDDLPEVSASETLGLCKLLQELERLDPQAAEVVNLRVFAGLTIDETALAMKLHPSAVNREWSAARAWLKDRLDDQET